jgi:hypothetical protein
MEVPPYEYKALDYEAHDHPIRLLKILPGEPGSPISCELFHTHLVDDKSAGKILGVFRSLLRRFVAKVAHRLVNSSVEDSEDKASGSTEREGNPVYTALSYVWGDPIDRVSIRIDGKRLSVTNNLFRFLKCHRDNFLTNNSTYALFWINAICINQSNIDKRSTQVQLMAEIYKKAKNVLVWLGEETESTTLAFEAYRRSVHESLLSKKEAAACSEVFKGEWFSRLWVVQEALLARSKVLRCGKFELGWESLKENSVPRRPADINFSRIRTYEKMPTTFADASWVLETFGRRECFDPKDVIFALRSIAPALMAVIPDYSLSTAEVFTSATRAVICASKTPSVLSYTSRVDISHCRWITVSSKTLQFYPDKLFTLCLE